MKINPIQFKFIQAKPQNTVTSPLRMKNPIMADTVHFLGNTKPEKEPDLLDVLVPKNKGTIFKKIRDENGKIIERVPVKVDIINDGGGLFLFKIDGKQAGGVVMTCLQKDCDTKDPDIIRDYENEGVVGDRMYVNYVQNDNQDEYGGIGHLADLLEVAACNEMGFKPNVISYSVEDSAPMHYVRGKRFIPFKEYNSESLYKFYDNKEPDDVVKEIIDKNTKGEKFDTSKIKDYFLVYMPQDMIKELEEELKEHPIF